MDTATRQRCAWTWPAMGTTWRIYHEGSVLAETAGAVAALVADDESRWSRFREHSELSHLNRCAGMPVAVSAETFDLLRACDEWTTRTRGVFQPLIGAALVEWGYRSSLLEQAAGIDQSPADVSAIEGRVELDPRRRTACLPAGVRLDLGGIAKSWSVVRAGRLAASMCEELSLLIDGGGDLHAVRGEHSIVVDLPSGQGEEIVLRPGEGVATSSSARRRWRNGDGVEAHHLIDPATGRPCEAAQATVIAADPVAADVLASVVSIRPEVIWELDEAASVYTHGTRIVNRPWEQR
jgi:thiamine biosynthesis lipoprotein